MQRISRTLSLYQRSDGTTRRRRQRSPRCTVRPLASAGVATLAPAFPQALPALGAVPTAYSHELRAELLHEFCAALTREGLAGPTIWKKCKGSSVVFAQRAIMESIGEQRRNLLERNVDYHLSVSDVAEQEGEESILGRGRLAVTIECGSAAYLKIGPAIAALEEEAEGLGAAFYWTLTYALYRVMRVYDHDDALQYEERMREYAEQDEQNREQYEFPDVEKALPHCIQKTLKKEPDHPTFMRNARRLLAKHRRGKYCSWIEHLRKIDRLSRVKMPSDACFREDGGYDSIPLPSLLVAFKDHDAVVACFDEESQYMLEGTAEPTLGLAFSPQNPDEVKIAIRVVRRFVALNVELFEMVDELTEWEMRDAGTHLDRGEPSLRAA
jgi:hypothetical protein